MSDDICLCGHKKSEHNKDGCKVKGCICTGFIMWNFQEDDDLDEDEFLWLEGYVENKNA